MRLVAGVLALTLFAPFVRAEDAAPRPAAETTRSHVPLRVVRVMPESHQALLFDRARATHVLAEVGTKLDGYSVDEIEDDEVVLSRDGVQFVLAAPEPRRERASRAAAKAADRAAKPTDTSGKPADGSARPADGAPVDPYADGEVRSVQAPDADHPAAAAPPSAATDPAIGSGEIRVAHAPSAAAPTRAIEPGSDGVRVAQAPMEPEPAPAVAPPAAGSSAPAAAASAPPTTSPTPTTSAPVATPITSTSIAPPTPTPIVSVDARPIAVAPSSEAPAAHAPSPSIDGRMPSAAADSRAPSPVAEASAPTPSPDARSLNAAMPDRPARGKQAAKVKPPRRTAAGKQSAAGTQTDDALGFADILSGDRAARSPRGPSVDALPAAPHAAPSAAIAATPAPSASRTAAPPTAATADAVTLSRADVDGALGDFAKLTAAIHASFSDTGVRVDDVAPASIFDRAGLRAGDTITAIDGTRLRSLDDAANLYARASTARALTVQLVRDGKPTTLRVAIQ